MSALPPTGEQPPERGTLPTTALAGVGERPFGIYVHVPFCATRCGYCDFNTYTADELAGGGSFRGWLDALRAELDLGARVLGEHGRQVPRADTVFVGGGTPSLLGGSGLAEVLDAVRASFGLSPDAEVTTEANPESTSPELFASALEAGYTRISLGMQSAAEHVLRVLDRRHTPGRAVAAAREAMSEGFEHVSLDLIYGTPGESTDDLRASLEAVLDAGVDHVSAYSLIVEDGTAMARRVRRGELPMPDEDVLAADYELVDSVLSKAGFDWYEVSNWALGETARCRHNLGYWRGGDWWGAGPGAHSHVGGVRWWNLKYPARYAAALGEGLSPAVGREVLGAEDQRVERVMLELRLSEGLAVEALDEAGVAEAWRAVTDGLLRSDALRAGRCVLTDRGRLLADGVVRRLIA
ncbi:coproporphyrinogen III oxidase [Actinopolyspora erythraea]|uniref:Heme chaperone HemW n=1 Tax=Actinopolyspora erythraea TaxID=414996 RepID=A0A099D100_9ACTN|nr:radical SAM family heme chaperone HemW [Actinopolyspora erythraea]ASU80880.1 coproporphyrinogen III oxidase [Actinopolyspora erythraea]KGI79724.1 coproporphyrinogen III oxidase [Actinopolyspora erythraea]